MKLITAISVLLPLMMLCPIGSIALRCHYCVGAATDNISDCPEGQATEVKECIADTDPASSQWWCRIDTKNKMRISLGCYNWEGDRRQDRNKIECSVWITTTTKKANWSCWCATDSCNIYDSNSLKCLSCKTEDNLPTISRSATARDNDCENGQNPIEERCLLGTKYCVFRNHTQVLYTSYNPETVVVRMELSKGCSEGFREEVEYKETGNGYSCNDTYKAARGGHNSADRECYCKSSLCNTYLNKFNPPPTTPSPVDRGSNIHPSFSLTLFIIISISVTASLSTL